MPLNKLALLVWALFEQYETLLKVRSENKADFEQLIPPNAKTSKSIVLGLRERSRSFVRIKF